MTSIAAIETAHASGFPPNVEPCEPGVNTSKYPEEKKSTEIPPVAASERGGAQSLNQHVC